MAGPAYYLGVDIGTTSTKAVLFNKTGGILASEAIFYPLHTPTPLTAEQDPEVIFRAVLVTVRETMRKSAIDPASLKLVSFSSAMHSLIAVGAEGELLSRIITWADSRAAKQAVRIQEE
ncbi:FGGY family carbohydrate kinase [Planococcus sp. CAU13]|uniref:FGGY family carbohydrate kinase n=1 Tax=Planococcus sp. CAU13 TaxID=1541197 RepID=UPI00052FDB3A|nr:FGGY family carbohydrate kinase [Planococcus sp. CAU13]